MSYLYRFFTTKTIGIFSNKDDAISLLHHIPNGKVEVFNNITPIGYYYNKNNTIYFNKSSVVLEPFMQEWFQNENISEHKDEQLEVFIPLSTMNDTVINKQLNVEELMLKIKQLEAEENENNKKLEEIKEKVDEKIEVFNEKKEEFDKEKRNYEKEKENWNQLKNKLEADKRVYFIIKEQLESGELTEDSIPILFQEKYPIFKMMDIENLINNSDTISTEEINNYLQIIPNFDLNKNQEHSFNDLFSSSDPIYQKKDKRIILNSETE